MESSQLEKCRRWLSSRWPLIGAWQRRHALQRLAQDGSAEAVRLLAEPVWHRADAELRTAALDMLRRLAAADNQHAQEVLCRLVIHHDHPGLREEVLAAGYVPHEEGMRAVFYFLTGQWEEYESLDFDHGLLRTVYEAGNDRLRRRIAAAAREAGRLEWVGIAAGGRQGRRLGAMTDAEWKAALTVLQDNQRWDEVWRLAQEAPPRWSALMLRRLKHAGWVPGADDDKEYRELVRLAEGWPAGDYRPVMDGQRVLQGHTDEVRCLAISRHGRLLASGSADKTVRLWTLPEGHLLQTLPGHRGPVNCVAISPDGRFLTSGGRDGSTWLWQLPEARQAIKLKGHSQTILCLAISPDSRVLATGSADSAIQLWSLPDGENLRMLDDHTEGVIALAISPDGRTLASTGGDCSVRLWSLPEGKGLRTLWGHRDDELDAVLCLAFSPGGGLLASGGSDHDICLWSMPGGQHLATLEGHLGSVSSLAISPDGRTLASGGADQTVRLWHLPDGDLLETLEAHSGEVTRLVFSPDGAILASASGGGLGHDHSVRLWSVPERKWLKTLSGHTRYVSCLVINPDGTFLASGGGDGTIRLWTSELARLSQLPVRQTTLRDLAWVQEALRRDGRPSEEKHALAFLAALMRRCRRHDVEVEEAAPHVIEVGEFDIEIEG
jgi:WD40 repeat protein